MKTPTISDLKAMQTRAKLDDVHVAWIGPDAFVLAHTDDERGSIDLDDCELHRWLDGLEDQPREIGYYVVVPHEPDAYSEPYGADPWDFHPLEDAA